ncbi:hypothetical protein B9T24_08495 [Acinetobacter sp. ANC 4654]|uniref:DUF523 domain-containing protein n=1 Tax=Acinetobacter sp. ANC 4654 TaxID=1977872 RepID=UPI000A341DF6|nr:DUF523 domain-containing protein [Acinetobacter sp. ANC 4654]OTG96740.1 hypothetical protein B9T24_08495 [Acinetobacter sp. ANC 4654]
MYLISACLAGEAVRYDGKSYVYEQIQQLIQLKQVITACPEVLAGLSIPRKPAEIFWGTGEDVLAGRAQVIDLDGVNVTQAFIEGAYQTLALAQQHHVSTVVLKENSPSCGSNSIYDGTFSNQKISAMGVTTALLRQHGFNVISEAAFFELLNSSD